MKIGELASASETQVETIRYYESVGLISAPNRSQGNYRLYSEADLETVRFIRRCRALDMALDEIRALLIFKADPNAECDGVNQVLEVHIGHVAKRVRELKALERALKELRATCQTVRSISACGILAELSSAAASNALPVSNVVHVPSSHRAGVSRN